MMDIVQYCLSISAHYCLGGRGVGKLHCKCLCGSFLIY